MAVRSVRIIGSTEQRRTCAGASYQPNTWTATAWRLALRMALPGWWTWPGTSVLAVGSHGSRM